MKNLMPLSSKGLCEAEIITPRSARSERVSIAIAGVGNGGGTEGAQQGSIVGTYLHGPVLALNPVLADALLENEVTKEALRKKW